MENNKDSKGNKNELELCNTIIENKEDKIRELEQKKVNLIKKLREK